MRRAHGVRTQFFIGYWFAHTKMRTAQRTQTMKKLHYLFAAIGAVMMTQAMAQEATVEAAPGAAPCPRPVIATNFRKKEEADEFNGKITAYRDCIQTYVDAQKKASDQHAAAANSAIVEFNAFSNELNEKWGKSKQ